MRKSVLKNSCLLMVAILFVPLGLASCEKIQEDFQSKHYLRCEINGEKFEKLGFLPRNKLWASDRNECKV
ncbi:MAG TPA: hypothetical protein DEB36_00990 [Porphyromonadaceae bacterium]|nr:hypothetical protein [Porphyromonadaceae bacterium]